MNFLFISLHPFIQKSHDLTPLLPIWKYLLNKCQLIKYQIFYFLLDIVFKSYGDVKWIFHKCGVTEGRVCYQRDYPWRLILLTDTILSYSSNCLPYDSLLYGFLVEWQYFGPWRCEGPWWPIVPLSRARWDNGQDSRSYVM